MSLAWHTAKLVQIGSFRERSGKPVELPKLKTLLSGASKTESKTMSPELQWHVMTALKGK